MEEATFISIKLANKVYIYLLTALELIIKSAIELYIKINLFTYNIVTTIAL